MAIVLVTFDIYTYIDVQWKYQSQFEVDYTNKIRIPYDFIFESNVLIRIKYRIEAKKKKNNKIDNEAAQLKPQYDGDYIGTRTTFLFLFQNRCSLPNEWVTYFRYQYVIQMPLIPYDTFVLCVAIMVLQFNKHFFLYPATAFGRCRRCRHHHHRGLSLLNLIGFSAIFHMYTAAAAAGAPLIWHIIKLYCKSNFILVAPAIHWNVCDIVRRLQQVFHICHAIPCHAPV